MITRFSSITEPMISDVTPIWLSKNHTADSFNPNPDNVNGTKESRVTVLNIINSMKKLMFILNALNSMNGTKPPIRILVVVIRMLSSRIWGSSLK